MKGKDLELIQLNPTYMHNKIPHTCTINFHIHVQSNPTYMYNQIPHTCTIKSHIHVQSAPTYMYNQIPHTCKIKSHIHVQSNPTYMYYNLKGKKYTHKQISIHEIHAQWHTQMVIQLLTESSSNIYFYLFSVLKYKTE